MSQFVDFAELKDRVSIEDAVEYLGLEMKQGGASLRGSCPHCNGGGPRALVVTPAKAAWYCFAASKGGDCIALVAHVLDIPVKDAASKLWERYCPPTRKSTVPSTSTVPEERSANQTKKLDALSHLEHDHPAIEAVGLDTNVATRLGIGYRTKGAGQGSVLIPVRNQDGEVEGWLGVQELTYIPKDFQPAENVVPLFKKKA